MKTLTLLLLFSILLTKGQAQTKDFTLPELLTFHEKSIDQTSRYLLSKSWEMDNEEADTAMQSYVRLFTREEEQGVRFEWFALVEQPFRIDYVDRRAGTGNTVFYLDALKWIKDNGYHIKQTVKEKTAMEDTYGLRTEYEKEMSMGMSFITVTRLMRESRIIGYKYTLTTLGFK